MKGWTQVITFPSIRTCNVYLLLTAQRPIDHDTHPTIRLVRAAEQRPAFRVLSAPDALGDAGLDLGPTGLVEGDTERFRTSRRGTLVRWLGPGN